MSLQIPMNPEPPAPTPSFLSGDSRYVALPKETYLPASGIDDFYVRTTADDGSEVFKLFSIAEHAFAHEYGFQLYRRELLNPLETMEKQLRVAQAERQDALDSLGYAKELLENANAALGLHPDSTTNLAAEISRLRDEARGHFHTVTEQGHLLRVLEAKVNVRPTKGDMQLEIDRLTGQLSEANASAGRLAEELTSARERLKGASQGAMDAKASYSIYERDIQKLTDLGNDLRNHLNKFRDSPRWCHSDHMAIDNWVKEMEK